MRTLLLPVVWRGIITRNFLRTDVFKILKQSGCRIVILTLEPENGDFVEEFAGDNIVIEKLSRHRSSLPEVLIGGLADRIYRNRVDNETLRIIDLWRIKQQGLTGFLRVRVAGALVGRSQRLMNFLERIYISRFNDAYYAGLFEKYQPDLYFSVDPYSEIPLLRRCLKNRIPVIAMIRSWDNLTNQGKLPLKFPKIIVWNEIMRDELVHFHGYSPDQIYLSGVPQFDLYHDYEPTDRREFFENIGGASERKLITYATVPPLISPKEEDILERLCESIIKGEFAYPVKLLVRMHPKDDETRYRKLERYLDSDSIVFEYAARKFGESPDQWSQTGDDIRHYADTLLYSDVIINVASTVSIEAAIFDTPVVNVVYDGYQNRDYYESATRNYDFIHYRNIMKTRGVRLARSHEELVGYINQYLRDPSLDREGRRKIVEQQCYKLDGTAGERIARYILQQMDIVVR